MANVCTSDVMKSKVKTCRTINNSDKRHNMPRPLYLDTRKLNHSMSSKNAICVRVLFCAPCPLLWRGREAADHSAVSEGHSFPCGRLAVSGRKLAIVQPAYQLKKNALIFKLVFRQRFRIYPCKVQEIVQKIALNMVTSSRSLEFCLRIS